MPDSLRYTHQNVRANVRDTGQIQCPDIVGRTFLLKKCPASPRLSGWNVRGCPAGSEEEGKSAFSDGSDEMHPMVVVGPQPIGPLVKRYAARCRPAT